MAITTTTQPQAEMSHMNLQLRTTDNSSAPQIQGGNTVRLQLLNSQGQPFPPTMRDEELWNLPFIDQIKHSIIHNPEVSQWFADALRYVEQVKVQFADEPEVYNRFLDILMNFNIIKSVYRSVRGHLEPLEALVEGKPELVKGLATFLMTIYRLEGGSSKLALVALVEAAGYCRRDSRLAA